MCDAKTMKRLNSGKWIAVPKWLSLLNYVSPVSVLLLVFYLGGYKIDIENRMFNSAKERDNIIRDVQLNSMHREDLDIHMPFEKKIQVFVPRTEVQYKMDNINEKLDKIMVKLNIN